MIYLEEITPSDKNMPIILPNDSFGTLKGLEHSVNPQLMRYARETDSLNAHARQENRRRLFAVYPFLQQVNYSSSCTIFILGIGNLNIDF